MSVNGINFSQVIPQDDINNLNDVNEPNNNNPHLIGGTTHLSFGYGNVLSYISSTMLQLLQLKGPFCKIAHEDNLENTRNC